MFKVQIELPETFEVPTGDTGKSVKVALQDIAKAHPQVLRFAVLNGMIGALNNVSRGKSEDGEANSNDVWHGQREKRAQVWMTGEWAGKGGGGERTTTALKEAFVAERVAAGATVAQIEAGIKAAVRSTFGDKEPATFSRFMDALAATVAKRDKREVAEVRDQIEAKYRKLADDAAAARAKAKDSLDLANFQL